MVRPAFFAVVIPRAAVCPLQNPCVIALAPVRNLRQPLLQTFQFPPAPLVHIVPAVVQQLGLYEHQFLNPAKIEQFQKLRTRLKGAREIVELANECGRQVCDEARHFACPFGDESMENCALRLEAKYDETIGLLLDLAEMMG